jgi:Zn-dependent M28 family amino/carboxypeptidase
MRTLQCALVGLLLLSSLPAVGQEAPPEATTDSPAEATPPVVPPAEVTPPAAPVDTPAAPLLADVSVEELAADINTLSSDEFGGRGLGSEGLKKAVAWHETTFQELGLEPFFGESYRQPFTLTAATPDPKAKLSVTVPPGKAALLERLEEYVVVSWNQEADVIEAPVVYAGHLIVASDRNWDDVKGMDLKGRILLVEVNEPGNREGGVFDGPNMTWYGRWAYKFEEAARQGAAGILLIHNDKRAGYGWNVVRTGWSAEDFYWDNRPETKLGFMGWVSQEAAKNLLKRSGKSLSLLRGKAENEDFRPLELGMVVRVEQRPKFRKIEVANVAGILRSSHPDTNDRYVVVSAHFDHLGKATEGKGDRIFNGAVDNCAATAAMVGTARHFVRHKDSIPFNLVFVGVTAEESGLNGSRYFAERLQIPAEQVWANINHEMTNVWGRTKEVHVYGAGFSELTEVARAAATGLGWGFIDDHIDTGGMSFRSDQLSFARAGIPAVWLHEGFTGTDGQRDAWAKREWYLQNRYHQVTDQVEADWDLEGTIQMVEWSVAIVKQLATLSARPKMTPGSGMATAASITKVSEPKAVKLSPCDARDVSIRRVLSAKKDSFLACYKKEVANNPALQGKLLLNIVVAPDGTIDTLATEENTLNNANVQNCIYTRLKRLTFPSCTGKIRRERFPFFFRTN